MSNLKRVKIGTLLPEVKTGFKCCRQTSICTKKLTASLVGIALARPDRYTLEALIKKARKNPAIRKTGAIGTFSGIVRELAGNEKTSKLEFEKYEPQASKSLDRIRD
ncbi:hypothetical protein ASJ81_10860 [Methanosarcina spelaei]|uniref:Uncharacterized protein n=1 Tax=Methanosarcina spelaei TaxID=1036679 RepID=A0A2A2HP72_9EURY|nr:molybdenum cofactor biosynthesis protein MoaE [Methanosarcina spelaei]PAV11281.1 hypothetical protein ASJ81_10860 [Methanosarcina spelaei]